MDSWSSCAPHANSHFPPPIAQAPIPIGVIFKSLCPSVRKVIVKSPSFSRGRRKNVLHSGLLLHPPDYGGKVFLSPGLSFFGIDCRGSFGRRHRKSKL